MTDIGKPVENPGIEILPIETPIPEKVPEFVPVGPPDRTRREEEDE